MEFAIRHYIPGRVRVHAPWLCHRRTLAEATFAWLRKFPGVKTVRANYECCSVVIEYERSSEAAARMLLGRLRSLTVHDLRMLVGTNQAAETPSEPDEPPEKQFLPPQRAPLILPTSKIVSAPTLRSALTMAGSSGAAGTTRCLARTHSRTRNISMYSFPIAPCS